jgi:MSHA biogenesis protein MshN
MSLINRVLHDLEKRSGGAAEIRALPNEVRPLPQAQRRRIAGGRVLLLFFMLIVIAGFWWTFYRPLPEYFQATADPNDQEEKKGGARSDVMSTSLRVLSNEYKPELLPDLLLASAQENLPLIGLQLQLSTKLSRGQSKVGQEVAQDLPIPVASKQSDGLVEHPLPKISHQLRAGGGSEKAELSYRKALAAINEGRFEDAQAVLRQSLHESPDHQLNRQLFLKLLLEQRAMAEARQVAADGIRLTPNNLVWVMLLARLHVDSGDLAGAVQVLASAHNYGERNADFLGFYAALLLKQGRSSDAVREYHRALQIAPQEARWWLGLAMANEAHGDEREARVAFQQARQSAGISDEMRAYIEQRLRGGGDSSSSAR